MIEVWLISWSDFLIEAAAGKIIAMVMSVSFFIYWIVAYKYAHEYFVDNMPDHKKEQFVKKSKTVAADNRNYGNLGVNERQSSIGTSQGNGQGTKEFDDNVKNLIASTGKSKLQVEKALKASNNNPNTAFENLLVDIADIEEEKEQQNSKPNNINQKDKQNGVGAQNSVLANIQRERRLQMLEVNKKQK